MTAQVSIVIPTRNEQDNVGELLERLLNASRLRTEFQYEAIVVDDGNDKTAEIASEFGANVIRGQRKGLAQAVIDGIRVSNYPNIVVMDGDLQHPPELLPQVVEGLKIHDLVVVTKHVKGSSADLSLWRKMQSDLGCFAARMLVPISDPMTGFFGIRKECLNGIELDGIGFKIGLEIFCKANWTSHIEIPMNFNARKAGQSKGTVHSLQKHLWRLYKESLKYRVNLPDGSEEWNAFYEGNRWHSAWKRAIADLLHDITNEIKPYKVLDVGGGSSPNINYIVANQKIGMDINQKALGFMEKHSEAIFVCGSVTNIPYRDNSFDFVSCIEVIEHLEPQNCEKAVSELSRVVRKDGTVVIATPNYSSLLWNLTEKARHVFQRGLWTDDHHTHFNHKSLNELCKRYGLEELEYNSVVADSDMVIAYVKK